jgi:3',5'-cyclic AMP phosphodiesterase CpdA
LLTDSAIELLKENVGKDKPFFMYLAYLAPHDPRTMPDEFRQMYDAEKITLPPNFQEIIDTNYPLMVHRDEHLAAYPREEKEIKRHIAEYFAMITHLDYEIGRLFDALRKSGEEDNTIVVFTGDNINNPDEKNLKAFLKIVKKLKVPYYIAIGDHDVYKANGLSKVRYYDMIHENNWFMYRHQPNFKFKKKGFVFLIVDGAKEIIPGSVGYYREGTLEWLEQELVKNENEDVIIFQHFPVVYPDNSEASVKSHKTYKVEEYKELLDKHHNVLAVLSGHFHSNSENMTNGVYHISTPSLIALPQSYKVIDIVTTKDFSPIIYTQLREFEVKE